MPEEDLNTRMPPNDDHTAGRPYIQHDRFRPQTLSYEKLTRFCSTRSTPRKTYPPPLSRSKSLLKDPKLKALTPEVIREVVGEYLTDEEIKTTIARRDLMVAWLNKRIEALGENKVLY